MSGERGADFYRSLFQEGSGLEQGNEVPLEAVASFSQKRARMDLEGAARWAPEIKSDKARGSAYKNIAESWVRFDPEGLSHWMETLPGGDDRDVLAQVYVTKMVNFEPRAAFKWADQIVDPVAREESLLRSVRAWNSLGVDGAREAIGETALSPEMRSRLMGLLERE